MEELLILILGVGLGFFVQTVAGFAAALVAMPIILFVLDLQEAVAIMSIFFFIFSIVLIYQNWKDIDKKIVMNIAISIVLGLVVGVCILKYGNLIILKKFLGVFILAYVAYIHIKKKKIEVFKKLGILFGFLGGIFSGLFSAGGALYVTYLFNKLEKAKIIRATVIGTLGVTNFLRVPMLIYSDILTYNIFIKSLYVLPFFLLSLYLGNKYYKRVNEKTFKNILMVLLLLSGISLIFR